MNWRALRILLVGITGVGLLAAASILWYERERTIAYYTDADTIRLPAVHAAPRDVLWQPPRALPPSINTDRDDYEPRLTNDGLMLYFVRGRAGDDANIYFCHRAHDGWSEPRPLDGVNTDADELGPEPSADGTALYFYSNRPGGFGGYDLWIAHRADDGWSPPVNLGASLNTGFNEYGPALTPDGERLYFASNRPREAEAAVGNPDAWPATVREDRYQNDYNLYVAVISDRGLGPAQPVHELNSPYNEGAPTVSPVGDFLYFASDRPGGRGGFDVYRSRWLRGRHLPPDNIGPSINSSANELDPSLSGGGFALHFSSDRKLPPSGLGARGDYDLFFSNSREVFVETEAYRASIDWVALLPYLVWLLLALLLLLLLFLFARLVQSGQYGKLSLLARCVLASVLVHIIILILLTFWGVSSSLSHWIGDRRGTRIALVSPAAGSELVAQIRGDLTGFQIGPSNQSGAQKVQRTRSQIIPLAAPAVLQVARSRLATENRPSPPDMLADAPARETPPPRESASPIRRADPISVDLPSSAPRLVQQEARQDIDSMDDLPPNVRPQVQRPPVSDRSPFVRASLARAELPDVAPASVSPRVDALSSKRIKHRQRPTLSMSRLLPSPPDVLSDVRQVPTAPGSVGHEAESTRNIARPVSPRYDASPPLPVTGGPDALIRRVDPVKPVPNAQEMASSITAAAPGDAPSWMFGAAPSPHQVLLPALTTGAAELPEQTSDSAEPEPDAPPFAPHSARKVRHRLDQAEPAGLDPVIHTLSGVAPSRPEPPALVALNTHDAMPRALLSAPHERQPVDVVPASAPLIPVALPPAEVEPWATAADERNLIVAADHPAPSQRRRKLDAYSPSQASLASPSRLDAPLSQTPEDHVRFPFSFPLIDAEAPRRPRLGFVRPDMLIHLPPLSIALAPPEEPRPARGSEETLTLSALQRAFGPTVARAHPGGADHAESPIYLPAAALTARAAQGGKCGLSTDLMPPTPDALLDGLGDLTLVPRHPAPPKVMLSASDLPVLPDEAPQTAPDTPTADIAGAVRGIVRDARTGEPLAGVRVRLDLADRAGLTATTGAQGDYLLFTPPVPDFVALSASHDGYVPDSVNIAAEELNHSIVTRDFLLTPKQRDIIALESDPDVHHLGDDRYTGRINSQFQKRSEGRLYVGLFELAPDQLPDPGARAQVRLLVRGAQRNNRIRINDHLLETRLNRAPRDGSFGPFEAKFPASWLHEGANTLEIQSVYGGSDYDDFEFVNIRIRLAVTD
jgi:hypothetical protein